MKPSGETLPPLETAASLLGESERVRGLNSEIVSATNKFDRLNRCHWRRGNYYALRLEQERRLIALAERIEYLHRLKSAVLMVKQNKTWQSS